MALKQEVSLTASQDSVVAASSRQKHDRRHQVVQTALFSCFKWRRKQIRRNTDCTVGVYVDWHEPYIFLFALGIITLSITDAFLTTIFISQDLAVEWNPVMAMAFEFDVQFFVSIKVLITFLGILFMVMHKNFPLFGFCRGIHVLIGVFCGYAGLVGYELLMYNFVLV